MHPKKREPHLFLEIWFDGRRDGDAAFRSRAQSVLDFRNVWQVKQFEEPVNSAPILRIVMFGRDHSPIEFTASIFQPRRDPFHLFPLYAKLIKLITGALKNKGPMPKLFDRGDKFFPDWK